MAFSSLSLKRYSGSTLQTAKLLNFNTSLNVGLLGSTKVLSSFELRWFYADTIPEPVEEWFRTGLGIADNLPLNPELSRDDYYLPMKLRTLLESN